MHVVLRHITHFRRLVAHFFFALVKDLSLGFQHLHFPSKTITHSSTWVIVCCAHDVALSHRLQAQDSVKLVPGRCIHICLLTMASKQVGLKRLSNECLELLR